MKVLLTVQDRAGFSDSIKSINNKPASSQNDLTTMNGMTLFTSQFKPGGGSGKNDLALPDAVACGFLNRLMLRNYFACGGLAL
jgi:hypothetical protein